MALIKRSGVWHWRKMVNGEVLSRSTKTADKKVAEAIAAKWESEYLKDVVINGVKPVFVHDAITAFLNARKGTGGYSNACVHMKWWYKLPNIAMKEIKLAQLQDIVQQRTDAGASHNTLSVTICYWNAVVNFAIEQGWTGAVKLPGLKSKRTKMRILTHEEEAKLLQAIMTYGADHLKYEKVLNARQSYADLIVCLLHTGARYSEIAHMTWDQVDLKSRTVYIKRKKNGNDTQLAMSNKLFTVLRRRKAESISNHVFPNMLHNSNCYEWLDKALRAAGISEEGGKITIHQLRHTYASRMLKAGLALPEVQQLLGHKNLTSTAVYLHIQKSTVASKAVEVLNSN